MLWLASVPLDALQGGIDLSELFQDPQLTAACRDRNWRLPEWGWRRGRKHGQKSEKGLGLSDGHKAQLAVERETEVQMDQGRVQDCIPAPILTPKELYPKLHPRDPIHLQQK